MLLIFPETQPAGDSKLNHIQNCNVPMLNRVGNLHELKLSDLCGYPLKDPLEI